MAAALDSNSSVFGRVGSNPTHGTVEPVLAKRSRAWRPGRLATNSPRSKLRIMGLESSSRHGVDWYYHLSRGTQIWQSGQVEGLVHVGSTPTLDTLWCEAEMGISDATPNRPSKFLGGRALGLRVEIQAPPPLSSGSSEEEHPTLNRGVEISKFSRSTGQENCE